MIRDMMINFCTGYTPMSDLCTDADEKQEITNEKKNKSIYVAD